MREFGREITNDNMQPFNNRSSGKQTLMMQMMPVPLSASQDSKVSQILLDFCQKSIGPMKQNSSHSQPPSKLIDSDTKEENLLMQGSYLTARGPNNKIKVEVDNAIHFIDIAEVHKTKQQKVQTVSENFRERLATYKKGITKDMTFAD